MKVSIQFSLFATVLLCAVPARGRVTPPATTGDLLPPQVHRIPRGGILGLGDKKKKTTKKKKQEKQATPAPPPAPTTTTKTVGGGGTATIPNEIFNLVKNIVGEYNRGMRLTTRPNS